MKMMILLLLLALLLLLVALVNGSEIWLDYDNNNDIIYSTSSNTSYAVYGNIINNVNNSEWNSMDLIMTSNIQSKEQYIQYYKLLGFAEGYLSCKQISQYYANFAADLFGKGNQPGRQTLSFIDNNYNYLLKMIDNNSDDEYWFEINALVHQIQGMLEGYLKADCVNKDIGSDNDYTNMNKATMTKFLLLMSFGDLYQITLKLKEPGMFSRSRGSRIAGSKENNKIVERCSALVKLVDNSEDILFAHNTWDSYETMAPRIFKHLSIPLYGKGGIVYDTYFSSSPGLLSSVDDFYTVKGVTANLAIIETTNSLFNVELLKKVQSESVLSYMRVMVSNKIATDGKHWSELFSVQHSGTYTNQWLVIDINKFVPGKDNSNQEYLFTVLEEVPGLIIYKDQTKFLYQQTYWSSYNYPFYVEIQVASGYEKVCELNPNNCYETVPRAQLFKAHQASVKDVNSLKSIMQLNEFQTDPLSLNNSCDAIACRGDLQESGAGAFGAIDAKVSSIMLQKNQKPLHWLKIGPTIDDQKVFCWKEFGEENLYVHEGSPDCYDFEWTSLPI